MGCGIVLCFEAVILKFRVAVSCCWVEGLEFAIGCEALPFFEDDEFRKSGRSSGDIA